jgi:hypothetical protein
MIGGIAACAAAPDRARVRSGIPPLRCWTPAPWRSGYAAACKAVYTGSIPVGASPEAPAEVELIEVGPTLKGANSEAELQAVKTALRSTYNHSNDTAFDPVMAIFNEANEQWRKDQELERLIAQVQAKAARDEKRNRPIQVKTFEV